MIITSQDRNRKKKERWMSRTVVDGRIIEVFAPTKKQAVELCNAAIIKYDTSWIIPKEEEV